MRKFAVFMIVLLTSLALAQQTQQPAAQQPATVQQPGAVPPADPRFTDPRWAAPRWAAPRWGDPLYWDFEVAMVRMAHLVPNAPAVDVRLAWLDGFVPEQPETDQLEAFEEAEAALSSLEYGDVTDYVMLPAGRHSVFVTMPDDELNVLYEIELDFAAGAYYTVVATGFVFGTDEEIDAQVLAEQQAQDEGFFTWLEGLFTDRDPDDLSLRLEVYDDVPSSFPSAGHANVRVIHAAPGSPNVDVWAWRSDLEELQAQAMPADPAAVPAEPVAAQPAQAAQEPAQQQALGPGDLRITVVPEDASVNVVGPNSFVQQLRGSQTLTGLMAGNYIVTATRAGYNATSQQVSLSAEEGAEVELQLEEAPGDAAAARRQEQPVATVPATQPADPAAAPAQPVTTTTPPDPTIAPAPLDPALTTAPSFVVISDHGFPFASDYSEVRAFDYDLEVLVAGSDILIERFEGVNLEPGTIYTIFITGTAVADYPIEAIVIADVRLVATPAEELMDESAEGSEPQETEQAEESEDLEEVEPVEPEGEGENNNG